MRVRVHRVTGMPCSVDVWVRDLPDEFRVYIDEQLISDRGARCLQAVLDTNVANWQRNPERRVRDLLRVHTG